MGFEANNVTYSSRRLTAILFMLLIAMLAMIDFGFPAERTGRPDAQNITGEFSRELSAEEYAKVSSEFLSIVDRQDPGVALQQLRERIKTDQALLRSCHALTHGIGQEAYKKYGEFGKAMAYQDEICNSGYLHGVIESAFADSSDIVQTAKTVCSSYPLGSFMSWECYHGVGHGLMYYTRNDLPGSLRGCTTYDNEFARTACANGVFMENFNTDQKLHPSLFLDPEDPFFPCPRQAEADKNTCYSYSPTYYLSLHPNDYLKALQWCETAEPAYRSACFQGVGSQAIKENMSDPKLVERLCMSGAAGQGPECVTGMIEFSINHYGSLEPATALCDRLMYANQEICRAVIRSRSAEFKDQGI